MKRSNFSSSNHKEVFYLVLSRVAGIAGAVPLLHPMLNLLGSTLVSLRGNLLAIPGGEILMDDPQRVQVGQRLGDVQSELDQLAGAQRGA